MFSRGKRYRGKQRGRSRREKERERERERERENARSRGRISCNSMPANSSCTTDCRFRLFRKRNSPRLVSPPGSLENVKASFPNVPGKLS